MNETPERNFYLRIWCLVFAFLVTLVVVNNIRWHHEAKAIERLVTAGADPIAARCAVEGVTQTSQLLCHSAGKQVQLGLR